jgi:rubredoxin
MREQSGNIPYYAFRLEDLRAWHVVLATCGQCRHEAPLHQPLLRRGRPGHTRLRDLEAKLRCRRCGNARHNRLSVAIARRD